MKFSPDPTLGEMEELDGLAEPLDAPLVCRAEAGAVVVPDRHSEGSQSSQSVWSYLLQTFQGRIKPSFFLISLFDHYFQSSDG